MDRKKIFAFSDKINFSAENNIITGVALPFNEFSDSTHPAFTKGVLVYYGHTLPLLLEHDFRQRIGDVLSLVEKDDGIYFVGKVEYNDYIPDGVSIGGEYTLEMGQITSLYIYEISLVKNPAYNTHYNIIAETNGDGSNSKNLIYMENVKVKFQENLDAIEREIRILIEKINAIDERLTKLEGAFTAISEKVNSLVDVTSASVDAARNAVEEAKKELKANADELSLTMNKSFEETIKSLEKLISVIQKNR